MRKVLSALLMIVPLLFTACGGGSSNSGSSDSSLTYIGFWVQQNDTDYVELTDTTFFMYMSYGSSSTISLRDCTIHGTMVVTGGQGSWTVVLTIEGSSCSFDLDNGDRVVGYITVYSDNITMEFGFSDLAGEWVGGSGLWQRG